jgi:GNAT superfamily N-acetyltransferase
VDPVALCAETTADWHAAWLNALGLRSERREFVWRALDPAPVIYLAAITLAADAAAPRVAETSGTVCDSWSVLDLAPFAFVERMREPWFLRPPGPLPPDDPPPDLEVVMVSTPEEVAEFELVSVRGFGKEDDTIERFSVHPPSILEDARMTMLTGRREGRPVAAAMGYRTDAAIGVYGVTTVASARGRGYASALTRALIDPTLPAVLSPSPEAEALYRRIGFEHVGELRQWHRA